MRPPVRFWRPTPARSRSSLATRARLRVPGDLQRGLPDGEGVVAGEHEVEGGAVRAHPLRRKVARLAGEHVPTAFVGDRRPRPPRLRRVVDPEPRADGIVRTRLAEQVTF